MIRNSWSLGILVIAPLLVAAPAFAQSPDGMAIFSKNCTICHTSATDTRAPSVDALRGLSPETVIYALTGGSMRYQGLSLSGEERVALAEYLTGRKPETATKSATMPRCAAASRFNALKTPSWSGWSPTVENSNFQSTRQAGLRAEQVPRLTLKWAFGLPDATSAWGQATIAGGRLFVGSQNGQIYSLDASTGCVFWTFAAEAGVRSAVALGKASRQSNAAWLAFFADQKGYAYAVDAETGEQRWKTKVEDHPLVRLVGSPTLHDGRLYVPTSSYEEVGKPPGYVCCTFRGSVVALDARTGAMIWKAYTIPDEPKLQRKTPAGLDEWGPSGNAIWSAPTVDQKRGALYVGVGNAYTMPESPMSDAVVAFDLKTGKTLWIRQLTTRDVYECRKGDEGCGENFEQDADIATSPALTKLPNGKDVLTFGQKNGFGYAVDPDKDGAILWRYRAGEGGALGGIQWGIAVDAENVYFPVADVGRPQPGGLHAVKITTGERVWYTPAPPPLCGTPGRGCSGAQSAAITVIPGVVFSGAFDGGLRAYSTKDGSILWEFDTNREFLTVNGVRAKGGSINGPSPTIAGGMLYVSSGDYRGIRGNVLLAFSVD